jgi:hypothetical protein
MTLEHYLPTCTHYFRVAKASGSSNANKKVPPIKGKFHCWFVAPLYIFMHLGYAEPIAQVIGRLNNGKF